MTDGYLLDEARAAREDAYCPYSDHAVGAAVRTENGEVYTGANVEVSGRSTSVHAEMMAVFTAVLDGATEFQMLAVSHEGGAGPCGLCLHTLGEFVDDIRIVIDEEPPTIYYLRDELHHTYHPQDADHHDHH